MSSHFDPDYIPLSSGRNSPLEAETGGGTPALQQQQQSIPSAKRDRTWTRVEEAELQQQRQIAFPLRSATSTGAAAVAAAIERTGGGNKKPHRLPFLSITSETGVSETPLVASAEKKKNKTTLSSARQTDEAKSTTIAATTTSASAAPPSSLKKYHAISNPRHAIPWNQRLPAAEQTAATMSSFSQSCSFMLSPAFWMRVEQALRNALLKWLATALVLPKTEWRSYFKHPVQFCISPILVGGKRVGHFVSGMVDIVKGLVVAILMSMLITWSDASEFGRSPLATKASGLNSSSGNFSANETDAGYASTNTTTTATTTTRAAANIASSASSSSRIGQWVGFWVFFGVATCIIAFFTFGGSISRNAPLFFSVFVLQMWFFPDDFRDWSFYSYYLRDTFISLAFAVLPGLLPFPRFAQHRAEELLSPTANSISIILQGVVASAWSNTQRLDLVRLRQMRAHIRESSSNIADQLAVAWWEPFSGMQLARAKARYELLSRLGTLMSSFVRLVDQLVNDRPDLTEPTSTFCKFGELLRPQLSKTLDAFDYTLLRLSDCRNLITDEELNEFRGEVQRFEAALLEARTTMYYGEQLNTYKFSTTDLFSAHFFFFLESAFDAVSKFKEPSESEVPSRRSEIADACLGTLVGIWNTLNKIPLIFCSDDPWAIASAKNAVKLASTMTAAAALNYVFGTKNTSTAGIIALMHYSESTFSWSQEHVQGLIYGSVFGFIALHLSGGSYASTVALFTSLFFVGEFIKTSQFGAALAGLLNTALMLLRSSEAAIVQDLVLLIAAMTLHLFVTTTIWPHNPILLLRSEIDRSISLFRDGAATLFVSLRPTHIEPAITRALFVDTLAALRGSVVAQRILIPAAAAEPTLTGTPFPMPLYTRVLLQLERMEDLLNNLCATYVALQSSSADCRRESLSLHWVVVRVICGPCARLAHHFSQLTDLMLLVLREGSDSVPTSQLVSMCARVSQMAADIGHLRNAKVNKIRARKYERVMRSRKQLQQQQQQSQTDPGDDDEQDVNGIAEDETDEDADIRDILGSDGDYDDSELHAKEDEEMQEMFFSADRQRHTNSFFISPVNPQPNPTLQSSANISFAATPANDRGWLAQNQQYSSSPPSSAHRRHRRDQSGSSVDHRNEKTSTISSRKRVDPALGTDVDSNSIHATASVLVSAQVIGRLYAELLESILDIVAVQELWAAI